MLRKLLLCSALLSPYALSAQEGASQVHFQGIDEPVVEQTLTPEQKAQQMLQNIEFITDRGNYEEYPYVLAIIDVTKTQYGGAVSQIFARPTFLREDASTDGKGIWLSSDLKKYAYAFSAKEQKLIKMRMARDPEFRKWFDDHTNALVEICGVGCRLEWKDRELVELGADGVVDEPLRDAAGNISFDNERPDRRILSFNTPTITQAIEDRPTVYSVENEQKFSKGFRVTAFATPKTMGEYAESWDDLENGLELTYGVMGQWNETSGMIPTYNARKFAPFPHIPNTSYATIADGFITLPEDGTYQFGWDEADQVELDDFAVLINDELVLGGATSEIGKPIKMQQGTYPIKVYLYNPSNYFGLVSWNVGCSIKSNYSSRAASSMFREGQIQSEIAFEPNAELTADIGNIVATQIGTRPPEKVGSWTCNRKLENKDIAFASSTEHGKIDDSELQNFQVARFPDWKKGLMVRGASISLKYRHLESNRTRNLDDVVYSPAVKKQDTSRFSKPIGEIEYSVLRPLPATMKTLDAKGMVSLDPNGYFGTPETVTTVDGNIETYLPRGNLVEYNWEYDAKSAGTHFIFPVIRTMSSFADDDENFDRVLYEDWTTAWDTLNLRMNNKCRFSVSAYDPDVSGFRNITASLSGDYMNNTAIFEQDVMARLDLTEPTSVKIKGLISCVYPFSISWITKSPTDLRFRAWSE